MRQTLLLARRLARWSNPLCQDANLNPLLLLSIWLPVSLLHTHVKPTCPSPVLWAVRRRAKPHNHLPSAWLLSSETWIIKTLFRCKPQQSYRKPRRSGTLPYCPWEARRESFGGNSTVRTIPSPGVLKASERAGHQVRGPGFICCRNT